MSEAQQFFAWIAGSFDGIERDYDRKRSPAIVVIGITRSSLRAYHRALGGKIDWYAERLLVLRALAARGSGRVPAGKGDS